MPDHSPRIALFEDKNYVNLLPLVYFRPVWDLRCGALTLREKISTQLDQSPLALARPYLEKFVIDAADHARSVVTDRELLLINGRWVFGKTDAARVKVLNRREALFYGDTLLAIHISAGDLPGLLTHQLVDANKLSGDYARIEHAARLLDYPWDAVALNGEEICNDFSLLIGEGAVHGRLMDGTHLVNEGSIFVAAGAEVDPGVVLDARHGPVWIDNDARVMANAVLEGPVYVGKKALIKIAAKIYENTSIGPVCKVGGEVEESIFLAYSNKQHEGFLGHAYLGTWVNLGADTNNSDLKNNYGEVTVMLNGFPVKTGQRFVGVTIGDHSKTAINTMFNTGTVVGVSSNIFGTDMPPKFVPSFSWGGSAGQVYDFERAVDVARVVSARRNINFDEHDRKLFAAVRELATQVERGSPL